MVCDKDWGGGGGGETVRMTYTKTRGLKKTKTRNDDGTNKQTRTNKQEEVEEMGEKVGVEHVSHNNNGVNGSLSKFWAVILICSFLLGGEGEGGTVRA